MRVWGSAPVDGLAPAVLRYYLRSSNPFGGTFGVPDNLEPIGAIAIGNKPSSRDATPASPLSASRMWFTTALVSPQGWLRLAAFNSPRRCWRRARFADSLLRFYRR